MIVQVSGGAAETRRFDLKLLEMGYTANLKWVCDQRSSLGRSNRYHWTIVGEWTCESVPILASPLLSRSGDRVWGEPGLMTSSGTYRLCKMVERSGTRSQMG